MAYFINKYINIVLAILILVCFFSADGLHVITYAARSVHQWRQSDCVAYAQTYYYKHSGLFSPATYNLAGKNGQVVSEFPIIYYLSAQLFRLFGLHFFIIRGLTFLCYCIGLFYLLAIIRLWIKKPLLALFPVLILATSPYFYYYALNFLPNVPAIAFSFAGLYYFLRYQRSGGGKFLWIGTCLFILASLLKPTDGGLIWFAWLAIVCLQVISKKKDFIANMKLIPTVISIVLVLASIYGWYKFANWYNDTYGNHQNLLGIYPIWEMTKGDILYTLSLMVRQWLSSYQQQFIVIFLGGILVVYIFQWKKSDPFLRLFTLFLILGAIAYDLLWFKAFAVHDYYQLVNVIPAVFVCITVFEFYERQIDGRFKARVRYSLSAVLCMIMILSVYHNRNKQHERYTRPDFVCINPNLYEVEPYLRKMGVRQDDIVVCVPDPSPNMSLAAINNYGYTESFNCSHSMHQLVSSGAAYLIINDSNYISNAFYKDYTTKLVGRYKDIYIYDIRSFK